MSSGCSGPTMEGEPIRSTDQLDVGCEGENGVKSEASCLGLSPCWKEAPFPEMEENGGGAGGRGREDSEFGVVC